MSNIKLGLKIEFGDKIKRLLEREYTNLDELKEIIQSSFSNLRPASYVLKYLDNDNDWLYIFDDSDLEALKEYSVEKSGKSIKLVVESQEDLAKSVMEPKRFNQSQIKDSCVAEVEAFLKTQEKKEEDKEEVKEETKEDMEVESLKRTDLDMDFEWEDISKKKEEEKSTIEVEKLQESLENTHIVETQPESAFDDMNIEPVIVEESSNVEINDAEIEEEKIETSVKSEEKEPEKELADFNIFKCLEDVQKALNNNSEEFCLKDVFKAVKENVKDTKAEKNIKKVIKNCKNGKGKFIHKMMKRFLFGGKCHQNEDKYANVVHNKITCDGCNKHPIVGVRYKCSECADFDLCQECESKDVHNHHVFLKLKYPMGVDIIYSHRTEENAPPLSTPPQVDPPTQAQTPRTPHTQPHHPHHPPHHGGWGQGPWGFPMGGPMGAPWGCRGGRRGQRRGWENNPLMQMAQQFLGGFNNEGESSSSESQERRERPKNKYGELRPVVTKKPSEALVGTVGGMQIVETTVQNQSPWPYTLKKVKLLEADDGIIFQEIETDVLLKKDESQEFCLAVQLPEIPGKYKAVFGFFNQKDVCHGQKLEVVFDVIEEGFE